MVDFTDCSIIEPADTVYVMAQRNPLHTCHCDDVLSAPVPGVSVASARQLVSETLGAICALG